MGLRDVIVVGAGPAGATAALHLARGGCQVLMVDRAVFPREKPCGGLLSGKTLAAVNLPLPEALILGRVNGVRLVPANGHSLESRHLAGRGALVDRADFDSWLVSRAQNAGAEFRQGVNVQSVISGHGAVTVYTDKGALVSRWVIGADGAGSVVAATAGIRRRWMSWQQGLTLSREWRGDCFYADPFGYVELHAIGLVGSLGWWFSWPGGWRIGVGASSFFHPRLPAALDTLQSRFHRRFSGFSFPEGRTQGGLVPSAVFRPALGARRVLLAGDAAGMADPFSGEGIHAAILSGQAAAVQVLNSGGQALHRYRRWWYRDCLPDRRLSLMLALACWKKGTSFYGGLCRNRGWVDTLAAWMDGCSGYGLLWRQTLSGRLPRFMRWVRRRPTSRSGGRGS